MFTFPSEDLMAVDPSYTKPVLGSAPAGAIDGAASPERGPTLEEGFNWGRIRRLAKKG